MTEVTSNVEPVTRAYDRDAMAAALGVEAATLPATFDNAEAAPTAPHTVKPFFGPLTDDEWTAVQEAMPALPVPKPSPDFCDRTFTNACIWYIVAKARGLSWQRLPPELGPLTSRSNRHLRWCLLDYWRVVFDKLKDDPRIGPERLRQFERLADDSETRRERVLKRRARVVEAG